MEVLPFDQILVPIEKLPDPEADGGDSHLTLSEQVRNCRPVVDVTLLTNMCDLLWLVMCHICRNKSGLIWRLDHWHQMPL